MSQEQVTTAPQQSQTINVNIAGAGANGYTTMTSEKSKSTALILCLLLGVVGGHLFYVGRVGKGVLYVVTFGLFFIGPFIDFISIVTGGFKDNAGAPLRK